MAININGAPAAPEWGGGTIQAGSPSTIPLILKGAASQTANLLNIQNSSATNLVLIDASGNTTVNSLNSALGGTFGVGAGTTTIGLEIGTSRTGDGLSFIDLGGDATYTDFGLRIIRNSGANGTSNITTRGTGGLILTTNEAGPIAFATTGTERMRIDSSGNVGIGMTPTNQLSLGGYGALSALTGNATSYLTHQYHSVTGADSWGLANNYLRTNTGTGTVIGSTVGTAEIQLLTSGAGSYVGAISFGTSATINTAPTQRMIIDKSGNVGIGVDTPAAKLDVNGSINATNYNMAGKNYIINGGFDYWQRGTSATSTGSATAFYLADRWFVGTQTGAGVQQEVISQVVDSTTGENYMQLTQYKASGFSAGFSRLGTILEANQTTFLRGQTVTLSWQAATPATANGTTAVPYAGNWNAYVNYDTNDSTLNTAAMSSADASTLGTGITSSLWRAGGVTSTSWTTYSMTFTVPTNARRLMILFANLNSSGSNNSALMFRRVQLELGSVATPFSRAGGTIGDELALCQRYYYRIAGQSYQVLLANTFARSTGNMYGTMKHPVTMRTQPAFGSSNVNSTDFVIQYGGSDVTIATLGSLLPNTTSIGLATGGSGYTVGQGGLVYIAAGATSAWVDVSAEL